MFTRRRAAAAGPTADPLTLTFLGASQPITSTSTSYSSISFSTINNITTNSMSSNDYWYIMAVGSRDASGESQPNWDNTFTVNSALSSATTAKRIGMGPAMSSFRRSFSTTCYYAWQTTDTFATGTFGLNRTHEGGVAIALWEFAYTGSDLAYSRQGSAFRSGSITTNIAHPNRLWSDYPTQTSRTFGGSKIWAFWANGTSNSTPANPTNNAVGVSSWGTHDYEVEHGTDEYVSFWSGEWTGSNTSYGQASSGGGTPSSSSQYNTTNILVIGDV